jgi:hypothetical protein
VAAVGRQSLSTFVSSVALAWIAGRLLDVVGSGFMWAAAVNLIGFATIFAIARSAAWIKSAPWSKEAERAAPRRAVAHVPIRFAPTVAAAAAVRSNPPSELADA